MAQVNLYQLLQIKDFAELSEVKKAFRQLALKYHPDRNPDPSVRDTFKVLVSAYEILGNPELKLRYDRQLKSGFQGIPVEPEPDPREVKRRQYMRMRKEKSALEEVENLTRYEKSLPVFPLKWRFTLIVLVLITASLSIMDGWYRKGSTIALGEIFLITGLVLLWNELYKWNWYKTLTAQEPGAREANYERAALTGVLRSLLASLLFVTVMIFAKKHWHLQYFGEAIEARLDHQTHRILYEYRGKLYLDDAFFVPDHLERSNRVYIKISSKEPEIWEFTGSQP